MFAGSPNGVTLIRHDPLKDFGTKLHKNFIRWLITEHLDLSCTEGTTTVERKPNGEVSGDFCERTEGFAKFGSFQGGNWHVSSPMFVPVLHANA